MRKIIRVFIILFLLLSMRGYSQENNQNNKNPNDVNFVFKTEQEPNFPAGDIALYTYFYNTIKYNEQAVTDKVSGNVMISFFVMPDSTLTEINILSSVGYGIDEEVVRALKNLKYAPGIIDGQKTKMNVIIDVPVRAH